MAWRLLSAITLLVMGVIHLYLVFYGVGGSRCAVRAQRDRRVVLAIAVLALRGVSATVLTVHGVHAVALAPHCWWSPRQCIILAFAWRSGRDEPHGA